jgi:hypothetical protein
LLCVSCFIYYFLNGLQCLIDIRIRVRIAQAPGLARVVVDQDASFKQCVRKALVSLPVGASPIAGIDALFDTEGHAKYSRVAADKHAMIGFIEDAPEAFL